MQLYKKDLMLDKCLHCQKHHDDLPNISKRVLHAQNSVMTRIKLL